MDSYYAWLFDFCMLLRLSVFAICLFSFSHDHIRYAFIVCFLFLKRHLLHSKWIFPNANAELYFMQPNTWGIGQLFEMHQWSLKSLTFLLQNYLSMFLREADMRIVSETTNSIVAWYIVSCHRASAFLVLVMQMMHLTRYF